MRRTKGEQETDQIWARGEGKHKTWGTQCLTLLPPPERCIHHPTGRRGGRSGGLKGHRDRTGGLQGDARSGTHGRAGSSGGHGTLWTWPLARPHRPWIYSPPKKNYWGDPFLGLAILTAGRLGRAVDGGVNFTVDGRLGRATVGRLAWAVNSGGLEGAANDGWLVLARA